MLSAILLAAGVAAAFPSAGVYRYTATMSGQSIGSWSVNVTQDAAHAQIDENSNASVMGLQVSAAASLVLGPDLAPVRYTGTYHTPMQSPSVSVDVAANAATATGAMTSQARHLTLAAGTNHFVVVEPGLLAGLFALPAQLAAWKETTVTWITPATAQAQALTVNAAPSNSRPSDVPASDAVLSVEHPIAVTIWYDPATLVPDEISVPSENAVLRRVR
ncbi:MAG: hypothetical protein JO324_09115 [Candidatus Eremiobacteraeota bacterium]|nr:hypothetical protein [Candidatus Eremiobacteraeota bacterium]